MVVRFPRPTPRRSQAGNLSTKMVMIAGHDNLVPLSLKKVILFENAVMVKTYNVWKWHSEPGWKRDCYLNLWQNWQMWVKQFHSNSNSSPLRSDVNALHGKLIFCIQFVDYISHLGSLFPACNSMHQELGSRDCLNIWNNRWRTRWKWKFVLAQ